MALKKRQRIPHDGNSICFVISPIGEKDSTTRKRSDDILDCLIVPALRDTGLTAIRADKISSPGMITTQIIRHIISDHLVIADLTDQNPNVFYELAIRHAFKKPIIQMILDGQKLPFDIMGIRTIKYNLNDARSLRETEEELRAAITASIEKTAKIESPVSIAARLEDLVKGDQFLDGAFIQSLIDQMEGISRKLERMENSVCSIDDFKETIPPMIQDKIASILKNYEDEIELLKAIRFAGVTGVFKRREHAIKAFSEAINQEEKEILIIGSSLKGLLQRTEYSKIREKLQFKISKANTSVKFLLTHPIVADFRASQENRKPGEIGKEIIDSLRVLRNWGVDPSSVRLYLGTPTCFAIKTTRHMLVNPYPYISVSYDSPCLLLEYSPSTGAERPGYFFDEFQSRHFAAWDSELSVQFDDFDKTINYFTSKILEYSKSVEIMIKEGKKALE